MSTTIIKLKTKKKQTKEESKQAQKTTKPMFGMQVFEGKTKELN